MTDTTVQPEAAPTRRSNSYAKDKAKILARLRRIEGQVRGVQGTLEAELGSQAKALPYQRVAAFLDGFSREPEGGPFGGEWMSEDSELAAVVEALDELACGEAPRG